MMKKLYKKENEKPMGPFKRLMDGYSLCVTFCKRPDLPVFDTTESWVRLNERSIRAMGFVSSEGYKPANKNWGKTFVKFVGFEKHPIIRSVPGPNKTIEEQEIVTRQTATTLCDYALSDAMGKFLETMRVKKPMSSGSYGFIGMIVIIFVGLIGGYLYMTGKA